MITIGILIKCLLIVHNYAAQQLEVKKWTEHLYLYFHSVKIPCLNHKWNPLILSPNPLNNLSMM